MRQYAGTDLQHEGNGFRFALENIRPREIYVFTNNMKRTASLLFCRDLFSLPLRVDVKSA